MDKRTVAFVIALSALTPLAIACSAEESPDSRGHAVVVAPTEPADENAEEERAADRRAALARPTRDDLAVRTRVLLEPWQGDYDGMVERDVIRALVPLSKTFYFLDGGRHRGISYEALKRFEKHVNEKLGRGHVEVHVVIIPVSRDELIPDLVAGYGDIALGNLTITTARREVVDFSDPLMTDVRELVVTGPGSPELASLDDLSGKEVVVRRSSSYFDSLQRLNARFREVGIAEARLTPAREVLEDEDLLEMVNAALIPIVIVDSHKARFWSQIFPDIVVHEDIAVATGGEIAWAIRKNSPELAAEVNEFIARNKKGTLTGNVVFNRYLRDTRWAKRALDEQGRMRFQDLRDFFQKYGDRFEVPWLLVAAQAYQESRLDQSLRSPAGAIGVMQLLPSTAADPNVGIPDIEDVESNIHAGTKYLRFIHDRYFADSEGMTKLDKALFSFAAYNAGPARIAGLRARAEAMGLDPDVWFRNVEIVAAQEIGRETVQYVSNIFKYYIAYERMLKVHKARGAPRD
ncbi:MAG: MltF family protein [Planctomycetota bacterium]|jgi:membrane-bound lytic murein transglycosylase MltF